MSYLRRAKRGIPKNSNSCYGCKNRVFKPLYEYEEDTNSYYKNDHYVICNFLKIVSSDVDPIEEAKYMGNINLNEEQFMEYLERLNLANDLHYGHKICGLYKERIKNNGHYVKPKSSYIFDDDVPF